MTLKVQIIAPASQKHVVRLPASKSLTHRALFLAGINGKETVIANASVCEDTAATHGALQSLGAQLSRLSPSQIDCQRSIGRVNNDAIDCRESGTTARLILPFCTAVDRPVWVDGAPSLRRRPFAALLRALKALGCKYETAGNGLPIRIFPSRLSGGSIQFGELPSSQFISSLLLAAPLMENHLEIHWSCRPPSFPYIEQTVRLMERSGLAVQLRDDGILAENRPLQQPLTFQIEPDFSAVAFWGVLALISGIEIELPGVVRSGLQGDEAILELLNQAGGIVQENKDGVSIRGEVSRPLKVDCRNTPDLAPALAVLTLFAPSPSTLYGVQHLQVKESNRLAAIQQNIAMLGGKSEVNEDSLTIYPQHFYRPAELDSYNDHRIAMSFAIAGARIPGLIIKNAGCVDKSYPNFWRDFPWWQPL